MLNMSYLKKKHSFIWNLEIQRDREERKKESGREREEWERKRGREIFHALVHQPHCHKRTRLGRVKPGAWYSIPVFDVSDRGPTTPANFWFFPRHISKVLESSAKSETCAQMECQCHSQQPNLLQSLLLSILSELISLKQIILIETYPLEKFPLVKVSNLVKKMISKIQLVNFFKQNHKHTNV